MSSVAKRYARALLKLSAGNITEAKARQVSLQSVSELFLIKESARVLRSPVMPRDLKKNLLDYALKCASADQTLSRFVDTVLESGRVDLFPEIIAAYSQLIDDLQGVATAHVAAVVALAEADKAQIADVLGGLLGKKINIQSEIDPALLGGFVARVGHYKVDLSLKTKLDGMAKSAVQDTYVKGRP